MKSINIFLLIGATFFLSCNDSAIDEVFDEINPDIVEKRLKQISVTSVETGKQEYSIVFNYIDNRLTSVAEFEEGELWDKSSFIYNDQNELIKIDGGLYADFGKFDLSELNTDPYDVYEYGEIIEYDDYSNPIKIMSYSHDRDGVLICFSV